VTTTPPTAVSLHVYDTTLRDGAQQEGLTLSVQDKLAIARHLDDLGVPFIEGGWPGAIPKDTEFFRRAAQELTFRNATLAAFGATRKAGVAAADDPQVRALLDSLAPVVTLVAKWDVRHVERAPRAGTSRGEGGDGGVEKTRLHGATARAPAPNGGGVRLHGAGEVVAGDEGGERHHRMARASASYAATWPSPTASLTSWSGPLYTRLS